MLDLLRDWLWFVLWQHETFDQRWAGGVLAAIAGSVTCAAVLGYKFTPKPPLAARLGLAVVLGGVAGTAGPLLVSFGAAALVGWIAILTLVHFVISPIQEWWYWRQVDKSTVPVAKAKKS